MGCSFRFEIYVGVIIVSCPFDLRMLFRSDIDELINKWFGDVIE